MPESNGVHKQLTQLRAALSETGARWRPVENANNVLLPDEFRRRLGAVPRGVTFNEIERQAAAQRDFVLSQSRAAGAPAEYDLRSVGGKNFITPIKDQGSCGSCVAFGVCAAMEGTLRVQRGEPDLAIDLSEAHLFYCHGRAQGRNCGNGWIPDDALQTCKDTGVVDEACYPYVAADQDCTGRCSDWQLRVHKVTGFSVLGDVASMKTWLSTKGPLTACFIVYSDFRYYSSGIYEHKSGQQEGGHCVTIVGYNDTERCWICKNSWGPGWGENGFFRIGYGECGIDTWQVCSVAGVTTPTHDDEEEEEEEEEADGVWQKDRLVTALWANDEQRNAWIYADTLGWRKLTPANDVIFLNLLNQSATAKAARRRVNFREKEGQVEELYVL